MYKSVRFSDCPPSSPPKPLQLAQGPLKHLFLVPSSIYDHAGHLKDDYVSSLSDIVGQDVSSIEELVATFLDFVARKVENSAHDRTVNREVLACIFRQFEKDLLHGNEIHAVAATLTSDPHSQSPIIRN